MGLLRRLFWAVGLVAVGAALATVQVEGKTSLQHLGGLVTGPVWHALKAGVENAYDRDRHPWRLFFERSASCTCPTKANGSTSPSGISQAVIGFAISGRISLVSMVAGRFPQSFGLLPPSTPATPIRRGMLQEVFHGNGSVLFGRGQGLLPRHCPVSSKKPIPFIRILNASLVLSQP